MTLAEKLRGKLSEWRPAGTGRHAWTDTDPAAGWAVHLVADRADSLSCLVWELTLTRTGDAPAGRAVAGWAADIAGRVGGLLEDLKLYEVDTTRDEGVLRSDAPTAKSGKLGYYEVRLQGLGKAVVRRYAADPAVPGRQQVAFALTHEVLADLAADIAGC